MARLWIEALAQPAEISCKLGRRNQMEMRLPNLVRFVVNPVDASGYDIVLEAIPAQLLSQHVAEPLGREVLQLAGRYGLLGWYKGYEDQVRILSERFENAAHTPAAETAAADRARGRKATHSF